MTLEELLATPPFNRQSPDDPIERVKVFSFELAYGANMGLWSHQFLATYREGVGKVMAGGADISNTLLRDYVEHKWTSMPTLFESLASQQYLQGSKSSPNTGSFSIGHRAWNLLNEIPSSKIFISYYNAESSAFSLLLLARMESRGLNPYLDITNLEGGEDWEKSLENNIIASDTVIVLIGPTTLAESEPVRKEIEIALRENKRLIPVLHNGCRVEQLKAPESPFAEIFERVQCVTVEDEKARYYNLAVIDILNIFKVNP